MLKSIFKFLMVVAFWRTSIRFVQYVPRRPINWNIHNQSNKVDEKMFNKLFLQVWKIFLLSYLSFSKPMLLAYCWKHCLHISSPYFLIRPWELEHTLHFLEPGPYFLGWEYHTLSWPILFLARMDIWLIEHAIVTILTYSRTLQFFGNSTWLLIHMVIDGFWFRN